MRQFTQRWTNKYLLMIVAMVTIFFVGPFAMNVWTRVNYTVSFGRWIPEYTRFQLWNKTDEIYPSTTRTLTELMIDKDASSEFKFLANVTLNRRSLSNYYIHGLKSGRTGDYYRCNIAFVHVHKAGGSTTKAKLQQMRKLTGMASVEMSHYQTTKSYDRFLREGGTSEPTVFWGGFSFGICDVLHQRPCSYMTQLRDPYDRIISAYFYCQGGLPSPLCGPVYARNPNVSITAWAIHQGSHFFNQLLVHIDTCRDLNVHYDEYVEPYKDHTKHIIQYASELHKRVCWFRQKAIHKEIITIEQRSALLRYVVDHLEHWFAVIGLLEEYQLSLELFRQAYHLPFMTDQIARVNKGTVRNKTDAAQIEEMKNELLNSPGVREALHEDIVIYNKAKKIFALQKEEFKRLNKLWTP